MEKEFFSSNDKFEFEGQDAFEGISLHTNKSFAPRKTSLELKINGVFHSTIERGLMDRNELSKTFDFQSQEPFTLSFDGFKKDERILMRYKIVEPATFIKM